MTNDQIKAMLLDVLCAADYDLYKTYKHETAEEPEYVDERMNRLIGIALEHITGKGN